MSALIELSRRRLLQTGVLGGVGAAVLAACGETAEVIKEIPAEVVTEVQVAGKTVVREVPVEVMKEVDKIVEVAGETKAGSPDGDGDTDSGTDSSTGAEPDAPSYGGADADAGATDAVRHAPIYITVNAHGHNYGIPRTVYQGFVEDGNLEGWFKLKRRRYQHHRDEIMWLAEETERVGARMSYQLNGEYARDARVLMSSGTSDDTGHLHDLIDRGHAMSAHFHPYVLSESDEFWEDIGSRTMTTTLMDQLWASHLDAIEATLGFGVVRVDPAHNRDTDELAAHFLTLINEYGLQIENMGESFSNTHWVQRPWNVFRRDLKTELMEDLDGPMVTVHSYPQVGQATPQGRHVVITTVPQLKRRFIDIYLQWLYAQATGQTPRIWTFGLMTHPDSNAQHQDDMLEMLGWLAQMTDLESPFGGPVAEFITDTELLERYRTWEAAHPGVSSFSFDLEAYEAGEDAPYPYDLEGMVLATHDSEFVDLRDDWADDGVMVVELVHRHVERLAPRPNGMVRTTIGDLEETLYLLWTESHPVVIDMSDEVSPSIFGCDGVTGDVETLDSSAVTVTSVPQVVSVTDDYFGRD